MTRVIILALTLSFALTACDQALPEEPEVAALGDPALLSAPDAPPPALTLSTANTGAVGDWEYVEVPGMECRQEGPDGTRQTGLYVRRATAQSPNADKLLIHLRGGGSCHNPATCERNSEYMGERGVGPFSTSYGDQGMFLDLDTNPFYGWNAVHVPNCTGDNHLGTNPNGFVPGVGPQNFVGASNIDAALAWFHTQGARRASQVAVVGTSSGAMGITHHVTRFREAFPNSRLAIISDSGILPETDEVLHDKVQLGWELRWGSRAAVQGPCRSVFTEEGDGMEYLLTCAMAEHPEVAVAYMGHHDDWSPRIHFGGGNPNAQWGWNPKWGEMGWLLPVGLTRAATVDYASRIAAFPNGTAYLYPGDLHSTVLSNRLYHYETEGLAATDWIRALLNYTPGANLPSAGL